MSYGSEERKPLLNFSDTLERATLIDTDFELEESMGSSKKKKSPTGSGKKKAPKKAPKKKSTKVKVTKGKVGLRVAGYKGLQKFSASELVKHIPISKLKAAGKVLLKQGGTVQKKKKPTKKKKKRN
jgi:hypothetical protein